MNQPAFPTHYSEGGYDGGMSIRTYIATACLQGLLTRVDTAYGNLKLAKYALEQADVLLRALEKPDA